MTRRFMLGFILTASLSFGWDAPITGGSNFGYYYYNSGLGSCIAGRDPFNTVTNYDTDLTDFTYINQQLQDMYDEGQRSIRVPIYFANGGSGGSCSGTGASNNLTNINSSGGALPADCEDNLANLLEDIVDIGYDYVEVSFHPQSNNLPINWPEDWCGVNCYGGAGAPVTFYENLYQENWNFIVDARSTIATELSSVTYRIDLGNELSIAHSSGNEGSIQYAQRLWGDYVFNYGKTDTIGFSIAESGSLQDQVNDLDDIYIYYGLPFNLEFHVGSPNAGSKLIALDGYLAAISYTGGLIIGEAAPYNDSTVASDLASAATTIGGSPNFRTVWNLMQWPFGACEVSFPTSKSSYLSFSNFLSNGW